MFFGHLVLFVKVGILLGIAFLVVCSIRGLMPVRSFAIWHENGKITFSQQKPIASSDTIGQIMDVTPLY